MRRFAEARCTLQPEVPKAAYSCKSAQDLSANPTGEIEHDGDRKAALALSGLTTESSPKGGRRRELTRLYSELPRMAGICNWQPRLVRSGDGTQSDDAGATKTRKDRAAAWRSYRFDLTFQPFQVFATQSSPLGALPDISVSRVARDGRDQQLATETRQVGRRDKTARRHCVHLRPAATLRSGRTGRC